MLSAVFAKIDDLFDETVEIRRYLHMHPELSFKEYKTAAYIANYYEELGIPYIKNVGGNGVIATLKGEKPGKTIALRADFDALPIQDEKDVPYKSTVENVMHACGHDGHTATLLTLAKALLAHKDQLQGSVVFLHQHAEELAPGGAKPIIETGELDHIDAIFGTHLWVTEPLGVLQTSKSTLMAGSDRFEIHIQGQGGHGAAPHETKDAIMVGTHLANSLQQIVSRRLSPLDTAVVTIGTFQAGSAFNIIADKATLTGTVRYLKEDVQEQVIKEIEAIIEGVCQSFHVTYSFEYENGYPPLINHPEEAQIILNMGDKIPGVEEVQEVLPVMGGEDFAYYLHDKPGCYFFTGANKEGNKFPHHHPKFDFDERAMKIAAKALITAYVEYQNK